MKKLLQINSVVNWGSTGKIADGIAQSAISHGWNSYIAYGRSKGFETGSTSNLIRIGTDYDVKLHGITSRFADKHGLGSTKATKQLIKQIEDISPNIIHLHNIHGYYLNIELLFNFLAASNIPIVWTLHDCWSITGHCTHFDFIKCNKWQTHCHHCPQKGNYPKSLFIDRSYKNYKLKKHLFTSPQNMIIVPVSKWLGEIVKQSYLKKYPSQVIHNGIDTEVFCDQKPKIEDVHAKYGLGKNKFMILGVANLWEERKGLKDFIKLSQLIDNNSVIVLVGLNAVQKKTLPSNIIGIERTQSTEELAALYRAADLFTNLTWEDNFPTINLEALACGCPVLTYDTGGSIEAVTPETGFIVSQGNLQGVLQSIEQVRKNGKEFYRNSCRSNAIKYYNINKQFSEYIKLYNKCLETKPYLSPEGPDHSETPYSIVF